MMTLYHLLCFLLSLIISFRATPSSSLTPQLCSQNQSSALIQFKTLFFINKTASKDCELVYTWHDIRSYPKTNSWKEGTDCCLWDGIRCDNITGHVISLDLSCSWLSGTIPSNNSLFLLSHLQRLDLSFNDFQNSEIPSNFGGFASLTHLELCNSGFGGLIPYEISYLSKLIFLDLSSYPNYNDLSYDNNAQANDLLLEKSTLNGIIQNLTKVRDFYLEGVNLSSIDPITFLNVSHSLTSLSLTGCDLRGNFPKKIFNLPNIKLVRLDDNPSLTVSFPKFNWSSPLEGLYLSNTSFSGKLPESIGNLKSLRRLVLIGSNISGPIPKSLGNLSHLHFLFLPYNNFGGKIPFSLRNLTKLHVLVLCCNQLEGSIPNITNAFPNLRFLDLSQNLLSGTTPSWLYMHPSLTFLYIGDNDLVGHIKEFHNGILDYISFSNNKFQGLIPSSISNLVKLTFLDFSSNSLNGTVNLDMFSKLQNLTYLDLSSNTLSLSSNNKANFILPNLQYLNLKSCNLNEFPSFLKGSNNLKYLDLSNNRIYGQFSNFLHKDIEFLSPHSNFIQGDLPILFRNISFLSVSNNSLSGEIKDICKLKFLEILDLSHNKFNRSIPKCIGSFSQSLSSLNLKMNKLRGIIPATFTKRCGLKNLNLNSNLLEGPLTRSISNCKDLEVLDLGNNRINDSFPHWVGALPELQVLVLHSNKFRGVIRESKNPRSFPKLRILDLSFNNFIGPLPTNYIKNFEGMINLDEGNPVRYMEAEGYDYSVTLSVTLAVKGFEVDLVKILTIFTSIDLSNNNFEGEIPGIIGELTSLRGLNLSHNNLAGRIPPSFGNLSKLEWLDLSSNKLVGQIPRELVYLTFLSSFDVSYNQLVGSIPQGKQFNTFENGSYKGNEGLCGLPLSRGCNNNEAPPSPWMNSDIDDGSNSSKIEFGWKVVAVGYGFGFILGVAIGCVALRMGKPKWLMTLIR